MSMIDTYNSIGTSLKIPNDNSTFSTFIYDHRSEILDHSTIERYELNDTHTFRYRPIEFLDSLNYPKSISWILLWINDMPNVTDFKDITSLVIPNIDHIISLRDKWMSDESNKRKAATS